MSEQKAITQITLDDVFPTPDVIMSGLEQSRASGELSASVTFATESFEAVDGQSDLFKKIHADGSEVVGRLVDGEFVANR